MKVDETTVPEPVDWSATLQKLGADTVSGDQFAALSATSAVLRRKLHLSSNSNEHIAKMQAQLAEFNEGKSFPAGLKSHKLPSKVINFDERWQEKNDRIEFSFWVKADVTCAQLRVGVLHELEVLT